MSHQFARRTVIVTNPQGLHARPAYLLADLAGKFDAQVEIIKDNERVDGRSILSILTLAAEKGTELTIETSGPDAERAVDALVELVQQGFPGGETAQTTDQNT